MDVGGRHNDLGHRRSSCRRAPTTNNSAVGKKAANAAEGDRSSGRERSRRRVSASEHIKQTIRQRIALTKRRLNTRPRSGLKSRQRPSHQFNLLAEVSYFGNDRRYLQRDWRWLQKNCLRR